MRKRPIPSVQGAASPHQQQQFNTAVKENLEIIMGQRGGRLQPLTDGASDEEIVAKINEIIKALQ